MDTPPARLHRDPSWLGIAPAPTARDVLELAAAARDQDATLTASPATRAAMAAALTGLTPFGPVARFPALLGTYLKVTVTVDRHLPDGMVVLRRAPRRARLRPNG